MSPHRPALLGMALATLLVCASATPAPTSATNQTTEATITETTATAAAAAAAATNYNCPADCRCVLAKNTHVPFLHARCSSLEGLKSEGPLQASLPIHSIDLSYLKLTRLSHALEKLRDLTSIDLSHNELHEIGHLGRRIKKLNLKHNRITSGKLSKLPHHLTALNLQHNDITYLPLEFTRLGSLRNLELSHNHLNCSCETLEVRNWLQQRRVFMEHPVTCSHPVEVKGRSWLQVKQSDICDKEKQLLAGHEDDSENELMMGDQPVEGSAEDNDEDEEELGKDYMPVDKKTSTAPKSNELSLDDVEGSGDLSLTNMRLAIASEGTETSHRDPPTTAGPDYTTDDDQELDDGSGSGGGIFILPDLSRASFDTDDFDAPDGAGDSDRDKDMRPVEEPEHEATASPDLFGAGMGIFDGGESSAKPQTEGPPAVVEEPLSPVVYHEEGTGADVLTDSPVDGDESASIQRASVNDQDDSNATYFLLAVLALVVVGLIFYVGIKRCKHNTSAHDAENPQQLRELQDMDKKNPGKPLNRNGHEHAPLIGEKSKSDMAKPINGANKKPYDAGDTKDGGAGQQQQQPLLQKNGSGAPKDEREPLQPSNAGGAEEPEASKAEAPTANANELAPHEYYPITPRYPTPKSPRASKYALYPQTQAEPNNNAAGDPNKNTEAYLPSSPKSGRYSPVYSPETGRVKIKLTETPRPKTPMLVTRSKSNAGEFITTPVHPGIAELNGGAVQH